MAVVKLFRIKLEALQRLGPLSMVPRIGEQNAAYIPENGANRWQNSSPLESSLRSLDEVRETRVRLKFQVLYRNER